MIGLENKEIPKGRKGRTATTDGILFKKRLNLFGLERKGKVGENFFGWQAENED
jgi:hypothetical protein